MSRVYVLSFYNNKPIEMGFFVDGALGLCITEEKLRSFGTDIELLEYLVGDRLSVIFDKEINATPYTDPVKVRNRHVYCEKYDELVQYLIELNTKRMAYYARTT